MGLSLQGFGTALYMHLMKTHVIVNLTHSTTRIGNSGDGVLVLRPIGQRPKPKVLDLNRITAVYGVLLLRHIVVQTLLGSH
jgi:hypothetical protein